MQMPSSRKVASWRDADTSATPDALKGVRSEQSARRCDGCFIVQTSKSTQKPDSNSGPAD